MTQPDPANRPAPTEPVRELTHRQKLLVVLFLAIIGVGLVVRLTMDGVLFPGLERKARAEKIEVIQAPAPAAIAVDVRGAVRYPGVYRLPEGARLTDAVEAAGGFASGAQAEEMNLAAALADGQMLEIPGTREEKSTAEKKGRKRSAGEKKMKSGTVSLNQSTAEQLTRVPGIGPATAEKIMKLRSVRGPFRSVKELLLVDGIGEKKLEKMKPFLTVE